MENEDDYYSLVDQYGRVNRDARRYVYDIETGGLSQTIRMMEGQIERQSRMNLIDAAASMINTYGNEHSLSSHVIKKPDCVLDDVLLNLKRGLKPYYQERLDYYIDENDGNKGCYIEYEPGVQLLPSQKVQWLLSKTVEKINLLYEAKKKAYAEKMEAEKAYKDKIESLSKSIKNYETKGHDLLI